MDHDGEDLDFLKRFAAGDREALGALAERYERSMLGLARGLLNGNADLACEAVQETWLRIIRSAATFKGSSSVKTWMYRILMNCCHDSRKSAAKTLSKCVNDIDRPSHHAEAQAGVDDQRELLAALSGLDAAKREAILLCYHAGMTQEQAAEILGLPLGTLKSRVRAGLELLRQALGDGA